MGFNNDGAEVIARRLGGLKASGRWPSIPIGINIGKSRVTPLEEATGDYLSSFEKLFAVGDYFVLNVSSPNTPGLRALQNRGALEELFKAVQEKNFAQAGPEAAAGQDRAGSGVRADRGDSRAYRDPQAGRDCRHQHDAGSFGGSGIRTARRGAERQAAAPAGDGDRAIHRVEKPRANPGSGRDFRCGFRAGKIGCRRFADPDLHGFHLPRAGAGEGNLRRLERRARNI